MEEEHAVNRGLLAFENVEVVYDDAVLALKGVSLKVTEGSIVALLGANGAGKTTALRACTGLLAVHRGEVTRGRITLDGEVWTGWALQRSCAPASRRSWRAAGSSPS